MVAYSEREKLLYVCIGLRGPTVAVVEHPGWALTSGRSQRCVTPVYDQNKTTLLINAEQVVFCELFFEQEEEEAQNIIISINGRPTYLFLPREGKEVEL